MARRRTRSVEVSRWRNRWNPDADYVGGTSVCDDRSYILDVASAAALAAAAAATTGTTVGEAAGSVVVAAKATKVAAENDAPTEIAPVSWLIDRCWTNYYTIIL